MDNTTNYKVQFGREYRAIEYEDAQGHYTFTFDYDVAEYMAKGTTKKLFLSKGPPIKAMKVMECNNQAERERVAMMLERVKEYLSSLGYEVVIV